MKLTFDQIRGLRNGNVTTLDFPYDPDEPDHGRPAECCVILEWEPERRLWDSASGTVVTVPRQKLLWVEVTAVKRHRKGHWRVQFTLEDRRHRPVYLGPQGSYTTSRFRAIDELEVIPQKDLERYSKVAYDRDRVARLERVAAARTDRWRFKRERQRAAARFRPAA